MSKSIPPVRTWRCTFLDQNGKRLGHATVLASTKLLAKLSLNDALWAAHGTIIPSFRLQAAAARWSIVRQPNMCRR